MAWIPGIRRRGLLEVVWALSMKQSNGFTRLTPTIVTLIAMIASFAKLSVCMKTCRSRPLGRSGPASAR